jgi:hypothetical protein
MALNVQLDAAASVVVHHTDVILPTQTGQSIYAIYKKICVCMYVCMYVCMAAFLFFSSDIS